MQPVSWKGEPTRDGKVPEQFIGVFTCKKIVDDVYIEEFATNDWSCIFLLELVQSTALLQRLGIGLCLFNCHDEGGGSGMVEMEIGTPAVMFEFISRQPVFTIITVDYIPH